MKTTWAYVYEQDNKRPHVVYVDLYNRPQPRYGEDGVGDDLPGHLALEDWPLSKARRQVVTILEPEGDTRRTKMSCGRVIQSWGDMPVLQVGQEVPNCCDHSPAAGEGDGPWAPGRWRNGF